MRRLILAVTIVTGVAACGSPAPTAAPATTAATSTTASTAPSTTTTTADPKAADIALIKANLRKQNDAFKASTKGGFETYAAVSYPPGKITAANILCGLGQRAAKSTGRTVTTDQVLAELERVTFAQQEILVEDSVEPQPDYVLPAEGTIGGGKVPDGRIYVFNVQSTSSSTDPSSAAGGTETTEMHATIIDGQAYVFPYLC